MRTRKNTFKRSGVALLIVLFIVMAITITALGFVARSDTEMLCGQNMVLRRQMDYLAESGLEHARGLLLNPQDVGSEYWTGGPEFRLEPGSNAYYDVTVRNITDHCTYIIDCNSYRTNGMETARWASLRAELRLDPCVAYWVNSSTIVSSNMNITGDVRSNGDLTNGGTIDGDVFATNLGGANPPSGQLKAVSEAGVSWPNLSVADLGPTDKSIDPNSPLSSVNYDGVCYSIDDVNMAGNVTINGTLIVGNNLIVSGPNNVIVAVKNFPALLVSGQVIMEGSGSLTIQGLAQIAGPITVGANPTSPRLDVTGALFVWTDGVDSNLISVSVIAAPEIASIEVSPGGVSRKWGPAAGAFFKSIERVP